MDESRTGIRFPIHLPVKINGVAATTAEPAGSTENMSAAGVYLLVNRSFDAGSQVTFEMTIPAAAIGAQDDVKVRCEGRVIRTDDKGPEEKGVACVIDSYEFVRPLETEG